MKKTILILALLIFINSVFAQEICEYKDIKTEFGYTYHEPGKKAEYINEKFVRITDSKVVKDLGQLKELTCLEFADFYNQGISGDLENLRELTNLKVLNLHTNPNVYGDICVFSKATELKSLKLAFDEKIYGNIFCLKDTNLNALYLSGTNITGNISALSGLTNLEELTLSDPETDSSKFYGNLASLDNLKKLRRVAIYDKGITNCEHFHEVHPNIEGGCSDKSKVTIINTNIESEKIIRKEIRELMNVPKGGKPEDNGPPEECITNGQFIGEEKCRTLMEKNYVRSSSDVPPPEECITNGQFIGDEKCRTLVDKTSSGQSEKTEQQERAEAQQEDDFQKNGLLQ